MRASYKLLTILAKFKNIDTSLFEHEAEWELLDELLAGSHTDESLAKLEAKAATL